MTTLYLMPTPLCNEHLLATTVPYNIAILNSSTCFVVEELKTARRYLKAIDKSFNIDEKTFLELNEHTKENEVQQLFKSLAQHQQVIVMSEAGCPGIADPGAALVRLAHAHHYKVVPLIGPSSIIMAVMASGLNGQNFAFNGYLPKEGPARTQKIKTLERLAAQQSQWVIETPYRNVNLLEELLNTLNGNTQVCIAAHISSDSEFIKTKTAAEWKTKNAPPIHKIPCVFGIGV
ncbi:MAG: SAM-dependent methyltransferase [Bacteroidetes bacterium]|nr:SAM-dependent methyltransferase [Bacteroidota bacterium]